jgi:hypothetical protein
MRNPPKEWNSAGNKPAPESGIHPENGILLGITGSWPWIQTSKIKNLPIGNHSRNINSKGSLPCNINFLKFKYEKFS